MKAIYVLLLVAVLTNKISYQLSINVTDWSEINEIGNADNDGNWGDWGDAEYCPNTPKHFVYGFRLKSEQHESDLDDTSLNAVELTCLSPEATAAPVYITSETQVWGTLGKPGFCPGIHNPVVGFHVQIDPPEGGSVDDVSANDMHLLCKNGEWITSSINTPTDWGTWRKVVRCDDGEAVMGIKTRIDPKEGRGDDTALNGVRLFCSTYE